MGGPSLASGPNAALVPKRQRPPRRAASCAAVSTVRGAEGTRTPDLLDANETRYQLRHSPSSDLKATIRATEGPRTEQPRKTTRLRALAAPAGKDRVKRCGRWLRVGVAFGRVLRCNVLG
jgi:hypothetical protein